MSRIVLSSVLILVVITFFSLDGLSQDKTFNYVGVKNCKMCHSSKKSGAAYKIWLESTHATAYETLANEESKKIAAERGIEDAQKAGECLRCHITAYGVEEARLEKNYSMEEGVTCEACHGPGSEYNPMKIMKQITAGEIDGAEYGLIDPDNELCVSCHNEESPTFIGFDYEEFVAKIAHPTPGE